MSDRRISVRLSARLHKDLKKLVRERGTSESEVVRKALEEYLQKRSKRPSAHDLAKEVGWIGCITAPPDLSTNPKYMEGFGRE